LFFFSDLPLNNVHDYLLIWRVDAYTIQQWRYQFLTMCVKASGGHFERSMLQY